MHGIEIFFVFSLVTFAQGTNSSSFPNRHSSWIIGGIEAALGEFPYMAFLEFGTQCCGGAIISRSHILTAAHCVAEKTPSSIKVTVGIIENTDHNPKIEVASIIVHPAHDSYLRNHDIALLKLQRPVVYSPRVQPIPLPKQGERAATKCVVTGWGYVQGSGARPGYLQKIKVNLIPNSIAKLYCTPVFDTDVWTMASPGASTSPGDSGGPLVCGGKLIGIVIGSISRKCTTQRLSMYAGVSNYVNWIKQNGVRRSSI